MTNSLDIPSPFHRKYSETTFFFLAQILIMAQNKNSLKKEVSDTSSCPIFTNGKALPVFSEVPWEAKCVFACLMAAAQMWCPCFWFSPVVFPVTISSCSLRQKPRIVPWCLPTDGTAIIRGWQLFLSMDSWNLRILVLEGA